LSRPSRTEAPLNNRERLKLGFSRAAPMRDAYPQLAELRVEFEFEDGTPRAPSAQAYSYFPAARGFFKYACPCNSCSGEFDLSGYVAELAGESGRKPRSRRVNVSCDGQRAKEVNTRESCPVCARIRLSATLHSTEST
jgi:hypothetical protein